MLNTVGFVTGAAAPAGLPPAPRFQPQPAPPVIGAAHEVGGLSWLLDFQLSAGEKQAGYTATVQGSASQGAAFAPPEAAVWEEVGVGLHAQNTLIDAFQTDLKELLGVNQSVRHAGRAAKERQALRSLAAAYVFDQPYDEARLDALSCDRGLSIAQATGLVPEDIVFQLGHLGQKTLVGAEAMLQRLGDLFSPAEKQEYRQAMASFAAYVKACVRRVKLMGDA